MMRSIKETYNRFFYILLLFFTIFFWQRCAPTVYSPHAQNEMITPYSRHGGAHEFGAGSAINAWVVAEHQDTLYVRTYPAASVSLYYNAYLRWGRSAWIGGIELLGFAGSTINPSSSGGGFAVRPYLGFQYSGSVFTSRIQYAPLGISVVHEDGGREIGGIPLHPSALYQLTMLLHNQYPSKNIYWVGARLSAAAVGVVVGYEHSFSERLFLRSEYSTLTRAPFSLVLGKKDLESIRGRVHYLTLGLFIQLK